MTLDQAKQFAELFAGRTDAVGLGSGGVARPSNGVSVRMYADHLRGLGGHDIGIFPMLDDSTVWFAAIDLDEHNTELALDMALFLPGVVWLEESRSKGYHIWAFFERPCPAWAARGVLRGASVASGRRDVEIFPKQDRLMEGMVGNYINLPLFGDTRPILWRTGDEPDLASPGYTPAAFLDAALADRNDPDGWEAAARHMGAVPPSERPVSDFGERSYLHCCAAHIIKHRNDNPLQPGHRSVVLFSLAKQILNCEQYNEDEALELVEAVNQSAAVPLPPSEVRRFVRNAARGRWTSTGCDEPAFQPYADPDCPIANPK